MSKFSPPGQVPSPNCWGSDENSGGRRSENTTGAKNSSERKSEHCMVCSSPLQYHTQAVEGHCHYCGEKDQWYISCPDGHFICDSCHNQETMQKIEAIIFQTTSTDPQAIAEQCMDISTLPMLGCQHTYIAGGALMAALKNEGTFQLNDDDIREVFHRTNKQAHGGYCGLTGTCGVAPALGACVAIPTGSKCGTDKEQRLTMELVSRVVRAITELTGPSCCKAYVRTSLEVAVAFLRKNFSINLQGEDIGTCLHIAKHPHGCREEKCPYYPAVSVGKTKRSHLVSSNLEKYKVFFDAVYKEGALDTQTKNLVALGASLAAGCEPWTRHCLAVAGQNKTPDAELSEVMEIAMTVAATKIQILQESNWAQAQPSPLVTVTKETDKAKDPACSPWA